MRPETSIAVIIPARNSARTLCVCLEALLPQLDHADQLLVVDDHSTDETMALCRELQVPVVTSSGERSASAARNTGASAVTADVLLFVDADVEVRAGTLASIRRYFGATDRPDALFAPFSEETEGMSFWGWYKHTTFVDYQEARATGRGAVCSCLLAVSAGAWAQIGGFDESVSGAGIEDILFGCRMAEAGLSVRMIPELGPRHMKDYDFGSLFRTQVSRAWHVGHLMGRLPGPLLAALGIPGRLPISAMASLMLVCACMVVIAVPDAVATVVLPLCLQVLAEHRLLGRVLAERGWRLVPFWLALVSDRALTAGVIALGWGHARLTALRAPLPASAS